MKQLEYLKFELNQYKSGLANVPSLIVANKIDTGNGASNLRQLCRKFESRGEMDSVIGISALYNLNTNILRNKLRDLKKQLHRQN